MKHQNIRPRRWVTIVAGACAVLCAALGSPALGAEPQDVRRLQSARSLHPALAAGAGVYVGDAVAVTPAKGGAAGTEVGVVTVRVAETLRGRSAAELRLPYARTESMKRQLTAWPDGLLLAARAGPVRACVLVLPDAHDPAAPGQPAPDGAAAAVLDGAAGESFGWVKEACRLADMPGQPGERHRSSLSQALTDASPDVRRYAVDALIDRYLAANPDEVTAAFVRQAERADELRRAGDPFPAYAAEALSSPTLAWGPPDARRAVVRALARLAACHTDEATRGSVVVALARVVEAGRSSAGFGPAREPGVAARRALSEGEIATLRDVLERMKPRPEQGVVIRWLTTP